MTTKIKHALKALCLLLIVTLNAVSQIPQGINYQAVMRNFSGTIMQSQNVTVKFKVNQATPNGTTVYEEDQATSTNSFGMVNLQIGQGAQITGSFSSIQWGTNDYFLEVAVDTGSGNFVNLGTSQFFAVPYAMVADTVLHGGGNDNWGTQTATTNSTLSGDGTSGNPLSLSQQSAASGQTLKWSGSTWSPSNDNDVQTLNLSGTTLSISNGNSVTIPAAGTGTVTSVATGTGLTGGPITTTGTISISNTGVAANTYGNASNYSTFTVNAQGQLTSAGTQPLPTIPTTLPPSGNAGGDLNGSYPNPTVAQIQGVGVSNTAPSNGQVLTYTSGTWSAQTPASGGGANTSLSNLTSTSVNQSLVPIISNAWDLGSNSLPWKNLWLGGPANINIPFSQPGLSINHTGASGSGIQAYLNGTTNSSTCLLAQTYGTGRGMELDNFNSANPNVLLYLSNSANTKWIDAGGNAYLSTGGNTWVNSSDINKKENIHSVNGSTILGNINKLQISQWNYKNEKADITHIGPMAQDFYKLFKLNGDDKSISTIDPAGVALVGIQELSKQVASQLQTIQDLQKIIAGLQQQVNSIQKSK